TYDAHGRLVRLVDPVSSLATVLAERNVERPKELVAQAFRTEVEHYVKHSSEGHDEAGLARLQRDCARVFLEAVGTDLDAGGFAPVYARAMPFELLPDVVPPLQRLPRLRPHLPVLPPLAPPP